MGYRIHTFSPERNSPTGQIADFEYAAAYDDTAAVRSFIRGVDALTFEFENVPSLVAETAAGRMRASPPFRSYPPRSPEPPA